MVKESLEKKGPSSTGKKIRNVILATALGATLIGGASACDSGKGRETDKESDKKGIVMKTQTQVQTDIATFPEEKTSGPNIESNLNPQEREIVSTEEYDDEDGDHIIKKVYEDGSRSTEREDSNNPDYSNYTEYYPNSKNVKFIREHSGSFNNAGRGIVNEGSYAIYDKEGKILYYDDCYIEENDGMTEYDKFDKQGRLISTNYGDTKYTYDDKNKQVTVVDNRKTEITNNKYKIVTVYSMAEDGNYDEDKTISKVFIGETGKEIDLMNGGIEKLIKEMHLENIPNIYKYEILH